MQKKIRGTIYDWHFVTMIDENGISTQHLTGMLSGGEMVRTSIIEDIRIEVFGGLIKMVAETMNSRYILDNFKHP